MTARITSFDNPAVGTGSPVNEVQFEYNDFGQSEEFGLESGLLARGRPRKG